MAATAFSGQTAFSEYVFELPRNPLNAVGTVFIIVFLKVNRNFYIFIKTICQIPEVTCEGDVVHKNSLKEGLKMNETFHLEDSQILRSFDNLGPEMEFTLKIRVSERTLRQARKRFETFEVLQTLMFCKSKIYI